jgi:uncharacterized membrane protein/mono/diheme cytochrome c family protein
MTTFIGHLHPVLVHLPIGILLLAILFHRLSQKQKYQALHAAVGLSLFLGSLSAVLSCISGFLLSQTGDYNEQLAGQHQWMGIGTAALSLFAYFLYKKQKAFLKWVLLLLAVLIIITGHLGGSLTHGSGYLTAFNNTGTTTKAEPIKPVDNVQEAVLYADVVKPLLAAKCYSCHGENKQKGKLRLDEPGFILKGGKDGAVINPARPEESELLKRILSSLENEGHMPPKEKTPLTPREIDLLHWWVSNGGDFNKKIKELPQTANIKPALMALQKGSAKETAAIADIPETPVNKAGDKVIQQLKKLGVVVVPVAQNSNYLSANFITAVFTSRDLQLLEPLGSQLIWLKLGNTNISDSGLVFISKLTSLRKLYLENTSVTDKGAVALKTLSQLQYLNITGTKITAGGIMQLNSLKNLRQLYVFNTGVKGGDYTALQKAFPSTAIDTGGYKTALLATDTTLVMQPAVKKH